MSDACQWLHEQLEQLQPIRYPFNTALLPDNGIYFFYEQGELLSHGGSKQRIVRIGTHRDGNFASRIAEHYLMNESKMNFDRNKPKPSDRSIFRKNIGRALLNQHNDGYLEVWEIDFTTHRNKLKFAYKRNIEKEQNTESEVTRLLRKNFTFRFIELVDQTQRMGSTGLESPLIATVAQCPACRPSANWLGRHSPETRIAQGKLWQVQHLKANSVSQKDMTAVVEAVKKTSSRQA